MTEKKIMKGNYAVAESAIRAGLKSFFAYPITPASEIPEYLAKQASTGRLENFVQGESEVSVINMVLGASCSGVRAMTASSSPGISLMLEGISYGAGMDLPIVVVNAMRGGPGLGDIFPSQEDYFMSGKGGGHGGYKCVVMAPSSVQEMSEMTFDLFNMAEKYRMPGILMYDGLMGQLAEGIIMPEEPNIEIYKPDWTIQGKARRDMEVYNSKFGWTKRPSGLEDIFDEMDELFKGRNRTKGQGIANTINSLYIDDKDFFEGLKAARKKKYTYLDDHEVKYEDYMTDDADIVVVAYGTPARISKEAVDMARKDGVNVGLLRPKTISPFPFKKLNELGYSSSHMLTVEMNQGQMVDDVKLAVEGQAPVHFYGRCGGNIPNEDEIHAEIMKISKSGGIKK